MAWAAWFRGGTVLVFSNTIGQAQANLWGMGFRFSVECASASWSSESCPSQLAYPANYPAYEQIGQGNIGGTILTVPIYCWSNSVPATTWGTYALGMDSYDALFIQQGRDIYTNSIMPGYAPLVYPHPLVTSAPPIITTIITTNASSSGPHPPSNLLAAPLVNQ
jgi:hypothetical protein